MNPSDVAVSGLSKVQSVIYNIFLLFVENPLCLSDDTMSRLADGLDVMLGEKLHAGISMHQLSQYYKVTFRTIERWRERYDDFPQPIDPYAKILSFPTDKVILWKLSHPEKF